MRPRVNHQRNPIHHRPSHRVSSQLILAAVLELSAAGRVAAEAGYWAVGIRLVGNWDFVILEAHCMVFA